jgi:hypothetical protein
LDLLYAKNPKTTHHRSPNPTHPMLTAFLLAAAAELCQSVRQAQIFVAMA